jgi:hypothetical protein
MKIKNTFVFVRMIASLCLILTVLVSSSMVALANSVKPVGELIVTGSSDKSVTVNGESAATGRTIFAASTITTPEGMTAVLDLGKAGKIELAPNTTYSLNSDGSLSGNLTAGSAKVLNSANTVGIKTLAGDVVSLNAGDMVTANSATAKKQTGAGGGVDWWAWAIIFGAAATAILLFTLDNDEDGPQASPVR